MRSLVMVAFLSQFGLQNVSRCSPAPSGSATEQSVTDPLEDSESDVAWLDRARNYGEAGEYIFDEIDDLEVDVSTGRTLTLSVFEPRRDGNLPLVVVSPGFQLSRDLYRSYAEHLASWGFVVVLQSYSGEVSGLFNSNHASIAEDTIALVDAISTGEILNSAINRDAVALVGHSLGGKISILAGILDPSMAAVVGLDPVDANTPSVTPELLPSLAAPLLLVGETLDSRGFLQACAPADNNFEQYFAESAEGTVLLDILGAGHMQFHDNPNCFLCRVCSSGATAESENVLAMSRDALTPFLLAHLEGYRGWQRYASEGVLSARWSQAQVLQAIR